MESSSKTREPWHLMGEEEEEEEQQQQQQRLLNVAWR
jgi:hypothetical protein